MVKASACDLSFWRWPFVWGLVCVCRFCVCGNGLQRSCACHVCHTCQVAIGVEARSSNLSAGLLFAMASSWQLGRCFTAAGCGLPLSVDAAQLIGIMLERLLNTSREAMTSAGRVPGMPPRQRGLGGARLTDELTMLHALASDCSAVARSERYA